MTARTRSSGRPTSSSPLRSAPRRTAYQWIALRPLSWKNRCQCHWRNPRDGADLPSCPGHLLRFSNAQRLQSNSSSQHLRDVPGTPNDLNRNLPKLRQPGPRMPRSRREPAAPQSSQPVSGTSIASLPNKHRRIWGEACGDPIIDRSMPNNIGSGHFPDPSCLHCNSRSRGDLQSPVRPAVTSQ